MTVCCRFVAVAVALLGPFLLVARARADEGAGAAPESSTTSVLVDRERAELDAAQREAESSGEDAPASPTEPEGDAPPAGETFEHEGQVGLRIGFGVPYVFAIKYAHGPRCERSAEETFCRRPGAPFLDLDAGFGLGPSVEVSVTTRLGVADDEAAGTHPLAFAIGLRGYTTPRDRFKVYFGGRFLLDATAGAGVPDWTGADVGLRAEIGLQVDVARYAGLFAQLGESISVLRSLTFATDGSAGVQVRFP